MTMKVLIPACNMESRLRNKYFFFGFFFTELADIRPFLWVCAGGGGVGGMAGVHPCVWEVGVLSGVLTLGRGSCICTPTARTRVCAPTEVVRVPACRGGRVSQPVPPGCVQLWLCTSGRACLFTRFRKHAPPLAPTRGPGTRVGGVGRPLPERLRAPACPRVFVAASSAPHGYNPPCRTAVRSDTCVSVACVSVWLAAHTCARLPRVCVSVCVRAFPWTNFAQMKPFSSTFNWKSIAPSL